MFTEKSKLTEKKSNPFYGSYKDSNILEEIHWQNRKKKHQLCIVSGVVLILTALAIGITLAITLPPLLEKQANRTLDPPDPLEYPGPSPSVLRQFLEAGVSSEHPTCSNIGNEILRDKNGSAVDAAIAVTFCLGVVAPQSSGLGGGLFMVVYSDGQMQTLNARETAPEDVNPAYYADNSDEAAYGGMAVGVPGELAGLWAAHQKFGKVSWADLITPASDLAKNGFKVGIQLANSMKKYEELIRADAVMSVSLQNFSSEFMNPATGKLWKEKDTMTRPRLARTLDQLKTVGKDGFYNGDLAYDIVKDLVNAGGIITIDDLSTYSVAWPTPISYTYSNNLTLFSLPFPSSGPVVAMALGILDGFGKKSLNDLTGQEKGIDTHHLVEALKFATAHRSNIADPDFDDLSEMQNKLLSTDYANELRSKIADYQTFDNPTFYGAQFAETSPSGTTHTSIIGPNGDAVSITSTINTGFGAGFMGNLTGIIFNNEMRDFSFPNDTSAFGLLPNSHNYVEAGKRPASSMAPLIFLNDQGEAVFATGGAGGSSIVAAVVGTTWRVLYREMNLKDAIDFPRVSPIFNPTGVLYEYGIPAAIISDLERKGHRTNRVANSTVLGNVCAVGKTKTNSIVLANSDFRKHGDSAGF
jgi:gamma-glutamyltranspeptidase/glutathione hydrolase/leukotriene-C4 hydrolase